MAVPHGVPAFFPPLDKPRQSQGEPLDVESHGDWLPVMEPVGEVRAQAPGTKVVEPPGCISGRARADAEGDTEGYPGVLPPTGCLRYWNGRTGGSRENFLDGTEEVLRIERLLKE